MAQDTLFPPELKSTEQFGCRRNEGLSSKRATCPRPAAESSAGGSYQLELLFETPTDCKGGRSGAFDFVCCSSGLEHSGGSDGCDGYDDETVGFDRVCALRGKFVHIFTFFHEATTVGGNVRSGTAVSASSPSRATSTVSLELGCSAECAAWNVTASCVVVGDVSGKLHFVSGRGTLLFSRQLAKPVLSASDGERISDSPRAFHCIKFASTVRGRAGGRVNAEFSGESGEELLAVSASLHLFHFANMPLAAFEEACLAQDGVALKKLRASISVSVADASSPSHENSGRGAADSNLDERADACVQSSGGGGRSRVFLVSKGGLGVWRRQRDRGRSRALYSGSSVDSEKGTASGSSSPRKLVQMDCVLRGDLFGGGGAISVQLSACGRWMVVADSRWGLSWWDAQSFLRLGRWTWPGDIFNPAEAVILEFTAVGVGVVAARAASSVPDASSPGSGAVDIVDGGDPRPCVACISQRGEVRVLRLGGEGAEELFRSAPTAAVAGVRGTGALTVPSPSRHQFLLVTSEPTSGKARFYLGKEAVPRHRLQALLAKGDFDQALELARAFNMDENDVHAARLLALLRATGSVSSDGGFGSQQSPLPFTFWGDVKSLFGQLSSPGALGRACDAAVRATLPTLEDVGELLEVVDDRLRSFYGAGARVQSLMLERLGAIFARLCTFQLVEGGRGSSLPRSGVATASLSDYGNGGSIGDAREVDDSREDGDSRDDECASSFALPGPILEGREGNSGDGVDVHETEVARWLRFRTTDLASFVGVALQAGDIQAAAVVWRRHGRTDRGAAGRLDDRGAETLEGRRLELALPAQLATVPAGAPPALLGAWLRDEVLPSLDVAGAVAVREWAKNHAREVEALAKRPHGALAFVRAVSEGSVQVLGVAAQLMAMHSLELAAAEASVSVPGRGSTDHWKPWKRDGLDVLESTLDDLTHAWDAHGLRLPLSTFERLPRDVVLFRVLDRVQSPEWLPEEISHHVMPLAKRYGLDLDSVLLDYMRICADAMAPRRGNPSAATVATVTGGNAVGAINSGVTTEQRAVAVARCMSAGEGRRSELRSKAVLALANAATFPFSAGLRMLVQDALTWGGVLDEELQRAATALTLSQIVQRYHVVGFNLVDATRATRLLRHVLAQVHSPTALEDGLQVAQAYSHLHETNVYVEFLQNLAGTYPRLAPASQDSSIETASVVRQQIPDVAAPSVKVAEEAWLGEFSGLRGVNGEGQGGGRLASAVATHRSRVMDVLRRVPPAEARRVAEEVHLYLIRLLEDLELDAVSTGLKPGQLRGCKIASGAGVGDVVGDAVVLDPGSEAEEAVLVTAAAGAVVGFLREIKRHPGGSNRFGALGDDLAAMANYLRRISMLQTELGAFASLVTLRCPRGRARWNVLREGLSAVEGLLHADQISSDKSRRGVEPPASSGGKKGGLSEKTGKATARTLPRLLHRARRLSELLEVPWASVVSHLAIEAASQGKVSEAVGLCNVLFRDKSVMDERGAALALALRDTAKALSTFVANQAYSGALRTDGLVGDRAKAAVFRAMAHSVRGLRQSVVLCDLEELPLTLDLLQGSEAVTAVLRRCEGGEELEVLTMPRFASSPEMCKPERDEDALSGLYKWYPGDGRVLPLEKALRLVSRFVRQEMNLREALVAGEVNSSTGVPPTKGALLPTKWQADLERAASPLLSFLKGMGAQQLCLRIVAVMAMPPPSAVEVLGDSFAGLVDKVLEFNHIDCSLAIGYMLALPTRQGYDTFWRTFRYSDDDYGRLRTLALVGMHAARVWDNHDLLHRCVKAERDAHWWHVLTSLGIPFDTWQFSRPDRAQVPGEYHRCLVPNLLERSGGDLALAVEFCDRYGVGEAFPCLLFVETQLGLPCTSPHDVSYQERIMGVLSSVHGVFLKRMLRHMLDTTGMICDRDYERLAFVHGLLLSDKCQEDEEDCPEEIKRLEDKVEALAILKDYTSPWPVGFDGMPIADGLDTTAEDLTKGPASDKVYSRRLPFRALLKDPWAVLEPQLRPDSVSNLVPLADTLGLSVGEFYSRLVKGMLNPGKLEDGTPSPVPVFSALRPWLDKIKAPTLACITAQAVAMGMSRDVDRLEALRLAAHHAVLAKSLQVQESPEVSLTLLPETQPLFDGRSDLDETINGDDFVSDDVEDVAGGLETRALRLENLMTAKEFLGHEMADRLYPFLSSSSHVLLTKLLHFAAESAAQDALEPSAVPANHGTKPSSTTSTTNKAVRFQAQASSAHSIAVDWISGAPNGHYKSGGVSRSMSEFRRRASRALRAARAVVEQRGLDPRDVDAVAKQLAKGWICRPKSGAGGGGLEGGDVEVRDDRGDRMGVFIGGVARGMGYKESVFVADPREERMVEDATLALRAAFVLTVTFSHEEEGSSVCDSIAFMDLKKRISMLMAIAQDGRWDGRGVREKFRARLRALLALSVLAPPSLVAEVIASDKGSCLAEGIGLTSLSDLRRNVGYMSELEEARLPHKLEELAACPAEDTVRALRRDHRGERSLIPLMCDMLLDAQSGDVGLWSPLLADACRHADLRRVLILRVFPRVVRSTVADAFARSGESLALSWEEALRSPLEELKARKERRRKKEAAEKAAAAVATSSFPGVSSTSFGASLYAMASSSEASVTGRGARRSGAELGGAGVRGSGGGVDWRDEDVTTLVNEVVLMLGACPFPERLDMAWFSSTLATLGSRFHNLAVRVALFITNPARRTAAVLEAIEEGGVPAAVALDELRPLVDRGDTWCDTELTNQATLEAVFIWMERRGAYADLFDTRHFEAMVSALVRAGSARGLVSACLANGRRSDANAVCRLHYHANNASVQDREAAAVIRDGSEYRPGSDCKVGTFLKRFAEEFGLELSWTDG